jgi:S-adenosylmethionine/arginine decarboxylase-like enzyme
LIKALESYRIEFDSKSMGDQRNIGDVYMKKITISLLFLLVVSNASAMKQLENVDNCAKQFHLIQPAKYTVNIQHVIADFFECNIPETNVFLLFLTTYMCEAANFAGVTPLGCNMYEPQSDGFSAVLILDKSYLSVCYYMKERFATVDFMANGDNCDPNEAIKYLASKFNPKEIALRMIKRPWI